MIRVLIAFGLLVFVIVLMISVFFAANRQLADAWATCMVDLRIEERARNSEYGADVTALLAETVDCVDERKGFLAGLFFDTNDGLDRYEAKIRAMAEMQRRTETEVRQFEEEYRTLQDDYESQQNLQQFREDAWRGGKQP